jgi:hypothetical protein
MSDASRRGRLNRSRGNAFEREVAHKFGGKRVGQYGGPDDVATDRFNIQAKCGQMFSEKYWRWLQAVPVKAGYIPLLVVGDAPGAGHKRRVFVVIEEHDFLELVGGNDAITTEEEANDIRPGGRMGKDI